jgi:hypothetical protein
MALDFENSVDSISDLTLWFKLRNSEVLSLADVPEIIRLRWPYFRDNWEFLKQTYMDAIDTYSDPDRLKAEIEAFTEFVDSQRTSGSNRNPFDNSDILFKFYTIFDSTLINGINTTYEEDQIIDNKTNRVTSFTRGSFIEIRGLLEAERDAIADRASATDEDYNRVFQRSAQTARVDIGNKDINKMHELNETIKAINFILANSFALDTSTVDPFALARANANNPAIEIDSYSSGTLVKMNYGEDLQALAGRTLGDPDRWIDIAIANGLKPPYIDEVGEKIPLISNASGNQINIAGLDASNELNIDKLSVGQIVLLQSDVESFPEQRNILNIREVPVSGELIIELDGEPDLDRYKIAEDAHIRIFKQSTTNSSFYILIPSTQQLDDELEGDTPWFLRASDVTEKRQKVDLALDDNGEINFDGTADFQLSYGLANSVQAVKLKLLTEAGELRRHPEYGLVPLSGNINQGIDEVRETLIASITENISADERFSRIDQLDVVYGSTLNASNAVTMSVNLVVVLAGSGQLVPITFSVNAS